MQQIFSSAREKSTFDGRDRPNAAPETEHTLTQRATLIALTRKGWSLPVLAALADGCKPRLYAIARRFSGASRAAVMDGVDHLVESGILTRNTGHGHPLRPDLIMTGTGEALARAVSDIWQKVETLNIEALARKRWTLPVIHALAEPLGFSLLSRRLLPATDRAITLSLKDLIAQGLVERSVLTDLSPPATLYSLSPRAMSSCAGLRALPAVTIDAHR
jgi:DNA-binding HxlR family transcriptional regulator